MKTSHGRPIGVVAVLFVIATAGPVLAQDRAPQAATVVTPPDAQSEAPPKVLTGKERLGEKWTDEQRVDNCKVPADRRGAKPRPDACADGRE